MSKLYVNSIYSKTGAAEAINIDSDGRVTTPARPAFLVNWSSNQSASSSGNIRINFDQIIFDIGSNVSNGAFTAPVSGIYQFNLSQRFDGVNGGYIIIGFDDDATTKNTSPLWYNSYRINGSPPSNYFTLQSSLTWQLTAGDVVAPWYFRSTAESYTLAATGSQFSGHLVG